MASFGVVLFIVLNIVQLLMLYIYCLTVYSGSCFRYRCCFGITGALVVLGTLVQLTTL